MPENRGVTRRTQGIRDNLAAGAVLAAALAAAVLVPHRLLGPASLGALGAAAAGLFGLRAYRGRLAEAIRFLSAPRSPQRSDEAAALLGDRERRWLGVRPDAPAAVSVALLRRRDAQLLSLGMAVGCLAIAAGIAAIVVYAD